MQEKILPLLESHFTPVIPKTEFLILGITLILCSISVFYLKKTKLQNLKVASMTLGIALCLASAIALGEHIRLGIIAQNTGKTLSGQALRILENPEGIQARTLRNGQAEILVEFQKSFEEDEWKTTRTLTLPEAPASEILVAINHYNHAKNVKNNP